MAEKLFVNLLLAFDKPPEEAVRYLESLGIKITWNWQERLDAIKRMAFTVSKVANADVLQDILNALIKAMKEGLPYDDFKTELSDTLKQRGYMKRDDGSAWRLDVIYRTNMQNSYMAGRFKQMSEVKQEFPYWRLVAVLDRRTTPGCRDLNGTVLPANHIFWKTNYPPRHHRCRDRVVALSPALLKQYGFKVSTGGIYNTIKPAKGFETAPGEWKPDLKKYDPKIKEQLSKSLKK